MRDHAPITKRLFPSAENCVQQSRICCCMFVFQSGSNGPRLFAETGPIKILFSCFVIVSFRCSLPMRFSVSRYLYRSWLSSSSLSSRRALSPNGGREFFSITLPNRGVPREFKMEKKRRTRTEVEDWTCDTKFRTIQRLASYRLRHHQRVRARKLTAPASEWTFKVPGFSLMTRTSNHKPGVVE